MLRTCTTTQLHKHLSYTVYEDSEDKLTFTMTQYKLTDGQTDHVVINIFPVEYVFLKQKFTCIFGDRRAVLKVFILLLV